MECPHCSLLQFSSLTQISWIWANLLYFSWERPLRKTPGETLSLDLVHPVWLQYQACDSILAFALLFSIWPGHWQLLCGLWTSCPHKWVGEQERDYGLQAALSCMLPAWRGYPEQSQHKTWCSPKTWRWKLVLQVMIKVHSSWDLSLKCTPLWPSISGFTMQGLKNASQNFSGRCWWLKESK